MATSNYTNRLQNVLPSGLAQFDSLVEQVFGPSRRPASNHFPAPASVWEADDLLHLELDAPGVRRDDVEVTFDKGVLTVSLKRSRPSFGKSESHNYWHNERSFGEVTRTLTLPEMVDPNSIEAEMADGVLHVTIAKLPEAQPKRIDLKN